MTADGEAAVLADAVNAVKQSTGSALGGGFLIDEYGRVLVPVPGDGRARVYLAGECTGPLRFHNPFADGEPFDLYDDAGMTCGDRWDRPYVGLQYQLSRHGELYYWFEDDERARKELPAAQDEALIAALRRLRPWGPVRFLVGAGGVVLTKVPPLWQPCYVGRLDLGLWFPKEELS